MDVDQKPDILPSSAHPAAEPSVKAVHGIEAMDVDEDVPLAQLQV